MSGCHALQGQIGAHGRAGSMAGFVTSYLLPSLDGPAISSSLPFIFSDDQTSVLIASGVIFQNYQWGRGFLPPLA